MTLSEILSFIATLAAAISAIVAAVTCITLRRDKFAKIKIRIARKAAINKRVMVAPHGFTEYSYTSIKNFAKFRIDFSNPSSVIGKILSIDLEHGGKQYPAEKIASTDEKVRPDDFDKIIPSDLGGVKVSFPIEVKAHMTVSAFFYFPTFQIERDCNVVAKLKVQYFDTRLREKTYKLTFHEQPHVPNETYTVYSS